MIMGLLETWLNPRYYSNLTQLRWWLCAGIGCCSSMYYIMHRSACVFSLHAHHFCRLLHTWRQKDCSAPRDHARSRSDCSSAAWKHLKWGLFAACIAAAPSATQHQRLAPAKEPCNGVQEPLVSPASSPLAYHLQH